MGAPATNHTFPSRHESYIFAQTRHVAKACLILLGTETIVADVSPSEVDLLLRDTVSHGVSGRVSAGVEPLVLSQDVESVDVVQDEEEDSRTHD